MNEWCIIGGFLDLFICYSNFLNLVLSQLPFPFPELLGSYRNKWGEQVLACCYSSHCLCFSHNDKAIDFHAHSLSMDISIRQRIQYTVVQNQEKVHCPQNNCLVFFSIKPLQLPFLKIPVPGGLFTASILESCIIFFLLLLLKIASLLMPNKGYCF